LEKGYEIDIDRVMSMPGGSVQRRSLFRLCARPRSPANQLL